MKSLPFFAVALIALSAFSAQAQNAEERSAADIEIQQPLTGTERAATARMTRLRGARLWWNNENRVVGVSLKGTDANNRAVAIASELAGVRTIVLVALPNNRLTDDGLAPLAQLTSLELLSISGDRITDRGLMHVQNLTSLKSLVLNGNFTDAGLASISKMSNLTQLDLTQSSISDQGLGSLSNLSELTTLILNGTRITNQGLLQIAKLNRLESLYLGNTQLDDSAIDVLQQMGHLTKLLYIRDTQITAEGIAKLRPALLSSCEILHDTGSFQGERDPEVAMARASKFSGWRSAK